MRIQDLLFFLATSVAIASSSGGAAVVASDVTLDDEADQQHRPSRTRRRKLLVEQGTASASSPWLPAKYPDLSREDAAGRAKSLCQTNSMRLCDPDRILSEDERAYVDDLLSRDRPVSLRSPCSPLTRGNTAEEALTTMANIQIAVALVRKVSQVACRRFFLVSNSTIDPLKLWLLKSRSFCLKWPLRCLCIV